MKRIVVVIEGGMLQYVFSEDPDVDVEVIDRDSDDPEERKTSSASMKDALEDLESGKLTLVY